MLFTSFNVLNDCFWHFRTFSLLRLVPPWCCFYYLKTNICINLHSTNLRCIYPLI